MNNFTAAEIELIAQNSTINEVTKFDKSGMALSYSDILNLYTGCNLNDLIIFVIYDDEEEKLVKDEWNAYDNFWKITYKLQENDEITKYFSKWKYFDEDNEQTYRAYIIPKQDLEKLNKDEFVNI